MQQCIATDFFEPKRRPSPLIRANSSCRPRGCDVGSTPALLQAAWVNAIGCSLCISPRMRVNQVVDLGL